MFLVKIYSTQKALKLTTFMEFLPVYITSSRAIHTLPSPFTLLFVLKKNIHDRNGSISYLKFNVCLKVKQICVQLIEETICITRFFVSFAQSFEFDMYTLSMFTTTNVVGNFVSIISFLTLRLRSQ